MNSEAEIKNLGNQLERASWFLTLFGMMTQLSSEVAFPSYNIVLGFWGAYCSYTRHGRATFGFVTFAFLAIIMDIVFCSINDSDAEIYKFSLTMLIVCLFIKLFALYYASLFFSSIGGARTLESSNLANSAYDSLVASNVTDGSAASGQEQGGYYPPESSTMMQSGTSFTNGMGESNL